jgi:hypothetical protein
LKREWDLDIYVDGNRSSIENWMRAQTTPMQELPPLSEEQKTVAGKLGLKDESYARSLYAGDLERKNLERKAEQAAQLLVRIASQKVSGLRVEQVWLKTFDRKFRFDVDLNGKTALIFVSEDLIDDLLENGSRAAEEQLNRIIDVSLPPSWTVRAS